MGTLNLESEQEAAAYRCTREAVTAPEDELYIDRSLLNVLARNLLRK